MHPIIKNMLVKIVEKSFAEVFKNESISDVLALGTNATVSRLPKASKSGTYSFKIIGSKRKYKLYGCKDSTWAKNASSATQSLKNYHVYVPEIIDVNNKYILSEWIEGDDLRNALGRKWGLLHENIVEYQSSINSVTMSGENIVLVSYVRDFLLPRFKKYCGRYLTCEQYTSVNDYFDRHEKKHSNTMSFMVSHPDLTPYNIVMSSDNKLVVVDNETLHYDSMWEFDVLNTANIVFAPLGLKDAYLKSYSSRADISRLHGHPEYWDIVWSIRMAAGEFQVGRVCDGNAYLIKILNIINS